LLLWFHTMKIFGKNRTEIRLLDDWKQYAPPKQPKQWKAGRSAMESARAWCGSHGTCVPAELIELLASHPDTRGADMHSVWPEKTVRFDKIKGEPRNSDIVALASSSSGDLAIGIEAKADESFDLLVSGVIARGKKLLKDNKKTGSIKRVKGLLKSLFGDRAAEPELLALRYQLLTAVAGALAFARENGNARPVFAVHEFSSGGPIPKRDRNTRDLDAFVAQLSSGSVTSLEYGKLRGPINVAGLGLYVGKMKRDLSYGGAR
jgi:hypothetical protein